MTQLKNSQVGGISPYLGESQPLWSIQVFAYLNGVHPNEGEQFALL